MSKRIEDLVEIQQLLARYAVTITQEDIDGLIAVFTPDGTYSAFGETYSLDLFPVLVDPLSLPLGKLTRLSLRSAARNRDPNRAVGAHANHIATGARMPDQIEHGLTVQGSGYGLPGCRCRASPWRYAPD